MLHESHPQSPPRAPRTRPSVDRCRDRFETIDRTNGRRARGGVCWPRVQLLPTLPHRQTRFCPRNEGTRFPPFARSSASSFQIPNENVHLARFTSSHVRHGKTTDWLYFISASSRNVQLYPVLLSLRIPTVYTILGREDHQRTRPRATYVLVCFLLGLLRAREREGNMHMQY
jgi:hypothetical protein